MQPPTFFGGVNLKLDIVLLFLGMVENLFEGEFSEKEKARALFLGGENKPVFGGLVLKLIGRMPTRVL